MLFLLKVSQIQKKLLDMIIVFCYKSRLTQLFHFDDSRLNPDLRLIKTYIYAAFIRFCYIGALSGMWGYRL